MRDDGDRIVVLFEEGERLRDVERYRSKAKMITIIYLIAGKLPLPQIHAI